MIYAQIAIFTSLPFYLFNSIGSTFAEKVVFAANKVSDRVDSMSAVERNKIQLSLNRLYNSLSQLQSDTDCKQVIIKNKSP